MKVERCTASVLIMIDISPVSSDSSRKMQASSLTLPRHVDVYRLRVLTKFNLSAQLLRSLILSTACSSCRAASTASPLTSDTSFSAFIASLCASLTFS